MAQSYIGVPMKRVEDPLLARGAGTYVDDLHVPGALHLVFVRSPYAHARILGIDAGEARRLPGVVAVLTADDLDGATLPPPANTAPGAHVKVAPPLARDVARFVGEPVAAVVAESRYLAEDAARLVAVDYDPLPPAPSIEAAIRPDAPRVYDDLPDNVCFHVQYASGDVEGLFARAAHRITVRIRRHRVAGVPLEPRGILVRPEPDGGITAWASAQSAHRIRDGLARGLALDPEKVRAIAPHVGGGFGVKGGFNREDMVVGVAAKTLQRPVRWVSTRMEDLLSTQHARDQIDEGEAAFDADGRFLALRVRTHGAVGAYTHGVNTTLPLRMISYSTGAYRVQALEADVTGVFTNSNPTGAYRGAGRPEATALCERIMDEAARQLRIDPVELRRRNFIQPDQFPYTNPGGSTYDSGDYPALLDMALRLAEYEALSVARDARRKEGELVGLGLATFIELTGAGPETGRVLAAPDGGVTAFSGSSSHGQGHHTSFAQLVAGELGVPFEHVTIVEADTARVPRGTGTFGSRSMVTGGGALVNASRTLIERALAIAADGFEVSPNDVEWVDGGARVRGAPERRLELGQIAALAAQRATMAAAPGAPDRTERGTAQGEAQEATQGVARDKARGTMPEGASPEGLEASTTFAVQGAESIAGGAYIALVSIVRDTGRVVVEKLIAVDDCGVIVNPTIVEGQVHGGLAQGLGEALFERIVYDADGQLLSGSLLDYAVPLATMVPTWTTGHLDTPSPLHPLGAKGMGEAGAIGAPPAILNAVLDALAPLGIRSVDFPLADEKVWRLIHDREDGA
ncbi:MAG: xanthine dehydrogenase family protein molybdopterin-binding subunit [Chloroflexi bacterium]|nr:xanthine dehydrogenase family protein molybdopterin-binding subunit [Chloroflexota bacterium]